MSTQIRALVGFAGGLSVTLALLAPRAASAYWFRLHHSACMVPTRHGTGYNPNYLTNGQQLSTTVTPSGPLHLICPVPSYTGFQLTRITEVIVFGSDGQTSSFIDVYAGVAYEGSNGGMESGKFVDTDSSSRDFAISIGDWFYDVGNSNYGYVRLVMPYYNLRFRGIQFSHP